MAIFGLVKNRFHIKTVFSWLPLMALALLILLSPCKVRNYIQAELGIAKTQALNKSQSAFSPATCVGFKTLTAKQGSSNYDLMAAKAPLIRPLTFNFSDLLCCTESKITLPSDYMLISDIPLYILYKNLTVYS